MLKLHANAIENANNKAEELLKLVKTKSVTEENSFITQNFVPGRQPLMVLDESEVAINLRWEQNFLGEKTSIFLNSERTIGIFEDDYKKVRTFLIKLAKKKEIRNKISLTTIESLFHKWSREKCIRSESMSFMSYLQTEMEPLIVPHQLLIPIQHLSIEKNFSVGRVELISLSSNKIGELKDRCFQIVGFSSESAIHVEKLFEKKIRPETQGFTAASITIDAEIERAYEIAIDETKRALAILRLFSVCLYEPLLFYSGTIWGSQHIDHANILTFSPAEDSLSWRYTAQRLDRLPHFERLDSDTVDSLFQNGLSILDSLLKLDSLNPYQEKLLDCLMLYSKALTAKEISDKLIYILVALESFFLKNSQESIVVGVGERMAFLIAQSSKRRIEIVTILRKVYTLRSKFIHHGQHVEEDKEYHLIVAFMRIAADTIITLINNAYQFREPKDLIDYLEVQKYS